MEMRIACLSTDPASPYGGRYSGSVQLEELVEALAGEGARVLGLAPSVAHDAAQPAAGATVEALPAAATRNAELERSDWLEARLMRFGADALYERLALPSAAGARAAARLGIPHLIDLDQPLLAESRRGRPDQGGSDGTARLEREVLARAERVFTVSSPLAMHALRCGARRVEVFPGAVAIERHPHRRRTCERPVAVFAGRVRPWHDIETVAAAWRLLGEAAPVLVIAGEAGEASELLEGVGAVLLGPIPHRQVPAVLAEADIGLAPYAREAPIHLSPLKLFEYMGAGLASVAGELPATHELVSAEQALLVPRGDPEALAAAVAGLAVDEPRRDRHGRTARALVAGAHTWRHRARRLMEHVAAPVTRDEPPEPVRDEEPRVRSRPAPRPERLPVPADPALPQMAQVLDTDVMAEVLARSLGENSEPSDVRVCDLSYKPETNLVVHYDVGVGGDRHHATAMIGHNDLAGRARKFENEALADMVDGRAPAERPLSFEPALGALVQWLPLDLSLWALAVPPAHRDRRLRAAGVHTNGHGEEPTLLDYRPQKRAVVGLNGHVLKYYATHSSFGAAVTGLEAADAAPVDAPGFEASLPELFVTVQSHVAGERIESPADAAVEAGATLARLHAGSPARLRELQPVEQLDTAAASAELVGRLAPALRPRLLALLGRLEAALPAELDLVPAHGDFDARRLLRSADGIVITDFESMCATSAALDVASYAADLVRGDPADPDAALAVLDLVVEGYARRPDDLSWYLATTILRRAPRPFHHQEEQWPERIEEMVTAAERVYA
jgi:glycosyltransferase involved in cell wall biosynthesis